MNTVQIPTIAGIILFLFSVHCSSQGTGIILKKIADDTRKSMHRDYILEKEKTGDLNNDKKMDIILIYKPRNVDKETESFDTPVIILLSQNNTYIKKGNSNILYSYVPDNSVLDYHITIKKQFFTLEQTEGNGNHKKKTYITFRFDKNTNGFFLSKYGTETIFPGEKNMVTKTQVFSTKDFGKIKFESFDTEGISSIIRQNK